MQALQSLDALVLTALSVKYRGLKLAITLAKELDVANIICPKNDFAPFFLTVEVE